MTLGQAYATAKHNMKMQKASGIKAPHAKARRKSPIVRTFGSFVNGECYTHLQIAVLGQKAIFKLWRQPSPTFYRLGKYIAADVRPISEMWPAWLHKVRADFLSRKV